MREHGVISLTWGDVSIALGPEKPEPVSLLDKEPEVRKGKPGKDGLFAAEQLAVYNRVIDAEE